MWCIIVKCYSIYFLFLLLLFLLVVVVVVVVVSLIGMLFCLCDTLLNALGAQPIVIWLEGNSAQKQSDFNSS